MDSSSNDFQKLCVLELEVGKAGAELERGGDEVEIHVIAAVLGGVMAQETIKLLTKQFVPVSDCFVFSGLSGRVETF